MPRPTHQCESIENKIQNSGEFICSLCLPGITMRDCGQISGTWKVLKKIPHIHLVEILTYLFDAGAGMQFCSVRLTCQIDLMQWFIIIEKHVWYPMEDALVGVLHTKVGSDVPTFQEKLLSHHNNACAWCDENIRSRWVVNWMSKD